jgi:hypothetical protein
MNAPPAPLFLKEGVANHGGNNGEFSRHQGSVSLPARQKRNGGY